MPEHEAQLRTLNQKRGAIKSKVTRFASFVQSINTAEDIVQLNLRILKFEPVWDEFEDVQSQIEALDNSDDQTAERTSFENNYFTAMSAAESFKRQFEQPLINDNPNGHRPTNSSEIPTQVKLPTISLPTFDGTYDQWLSFVDTFQSLIHNNENISPIQKFHYLRSSLQGDAAQVVHSLEISSLNYEVAWTLLNERYQNKRVIVQNHVKALFDLPTITKESASALRQLLDAVLRHLRALKSLEQPTESWTLL